MTLKKSEKRLLIILGVAVLFFLFDRLFLSSKSNDTPSPATDLASRFVPVSKTAAPETAAESLRKRYMTWGRDPFFYSAGSSTKEQQRKRPKLNGLFWRQGKAYALVNDTILGEGEANKGLRVEKIEGTEVLLSEGSRSFTLYWRESP